MSASSIDLADYDAMALARWTVKKGGKEHRLRGW
jgi:hypothetical protein